MEEWQQAVADVQDRNTAAQRQWFRDLLMAQAQGLPAPPDPITEPQPQRPTPPVQPQQEEDQQQQQHEGGEQQQPDDNEMVDFDLDFD